MVEESTTGVEQSTTGKPNSVSSGLRSSVQQQGSVRQPESVRQRGSAHGSKTSARTILENSTFAAPSIDVALEPELQRKTSTGASPVIGFSRDEMNLAEFPLTVLSTRSDPKVKTLEFSDHLRLKNGELIERKWTITGADKFGLPTSTDDDVILGLIRLSMDDGFRNRKIFFTRYELLKALRWSTEGRSYSRLTKSLDRLSGVRIRAANSFYDNSSKSYQTCNFGIIDAYEINDHRSKKTGGEDEAPQSFFIWSEMLFDSFRAGFIKKLDLDLYFTLKSAVSRRLYRYLDKHFYFKSTVEKPLMSLAFEKLGLSRNYRYVSSIRQQLEPGIEELIAHGFLSRYEILGKGEQTVIRFISGTQAVSPMTHFPTQPHFPAHAASAAPKAPKDSRNSAPAPRALASEGERDFDSPPPRRGYSLAESTSSADFGRPAGGGRAAFEGRGDQLGRGPIGRGDLDRRPAPLKDQLIEALVSRGITLQQARRLIDDKSANDLETIDRIVQYYDHLVETNDSKVSRSKIGFLYRAVESPYRFNVPVSFGTEKRPGAERNAGSYGSKPSGRPEHKVKTAEGLRRQDQALSEHSEGYRDFVEQQIAIGAKVLGADELTQIQADVERKMSCLKTVLSAERFQEAVNGCVREELIRALKLPDFSAWRQQK